MSALPPKADICSPQPHVRQVPIAGTQTKSVRGGARSGRRAADQPHRAGQAHARAVHMRRQRRTDGRDGG